MRGADPQKLRTGITFTSPQVTFCINVGCRSTFLKEAVGSKSGAYGHFFFYGKRRIQAEKSQRVRPHCSVMLKISWLVQSKKVIATLYRDMNDNPGSFTAVEAEHGS